MRICFPRRQLNRTLLIVLLFGFLGASRGSCAESGVGELGNLSGEVSYTSTTDQIFQSEFSFYEMNHRRDLFWPYPDERETGWDWGTRFQLFEGTNQVSSYQGRKAAALLVRKYSPRILFESQLGINSLNNKTLSTTANTLFAEIGAQFFVGDSVELYARVLHDYVYQDLIQPGGVSSALAAISGYIDGVYKPGERWRAPLHAKDRAFSDGNELRDVDLSLLYGVSTSVPWIWVGVGAEYLTYSKTQPTYWSPAQFYSYGLRGEIVAPISGAFSGSLGLNLNRQTENTLSTQNGYYGSAKIQYGERDKFNVALFYTQILSLQESSQWRLDQVGINLNAPF